jgi:SSS family solute:Na+ symporter
MAEAFLGRPSRFFVSIVIVAAWTAIVAAQLTALMRLVSAMTGISADGAVALVLATLLVTVHALGGQAAIIRLDRWQTPFIAGGLLLLLFALWRANPGWAIGVRLEAVNEHFSPYELAGYLLVIGSNYLVCPMLFGRFFSARDGVAARVGGLWAAVGLALFSLLVVAVGLACRGLIPEGTAQDAALLSGLSLVLPGFAGLCVMGALVAAVVSSADSCLVTAGTVLGNDLLGQRRAGVLRLCVVLVALGSAYIASFGRGILDYLFMAYHIYAAGVVMPVFLGLLLPKRLKMDTRYAAAAVALGGAMGFVAAVSGEKAWSAGGMVAAAWVVLIGVRENTSE